MKNVGSPVDVVVTGHTHLARAIELGGGRLYFNSGTWIRLMRFTDAMLRDSASFKPVYDALLKGTIAELDSAKHNGESLVMDYTTEVELFADSQGLVGRLNRISDNGTCIEPPEKELMRRSHG